jgi:hypothetical protein
VSYRHSRYCYMFWGIKLVLLMLISASTLKRQKGAASTSPINAQQLIAISY